MEIKSMLFLLVLFGTPALVLATSGTKFLPVKSKLKLAIISFFIIYTFIVGSAQVVDYQLEQELYAFDVNGDGSFSLEETTPEAKVVMNRLANDTGRTFAPITGFIFSLLYVVLFYGIVSLVSRHVFKNT